MIRRQVVGGLLWRDGRILLGLRSALRRICPQCWDAIGGHVERGETHEQALVRELREELGILATHFSPLAALAFPAPQAADYAMYRIDAWEGAPFVANDEHTALAWFSPAAAAALPNLASARYRPIFAALRP
jgi:mutator protein MutT